MNEKEIYSVKAPLEATKKEASIGTFAFIILCAFLMWVAKFLPYSGIIQLGVLLLFAFLIYSMMKRTLFDITYFLFDDRLEWRRRYGTITMENEVFPLDEAEFYEDKIIFRGKKYAFHPDDKLKKLLEIK
jgi:hypothetical protein